MIMYFLIGRIVNALPDLVLSDRLDHLLRRVIVEDWVDSVNFYFPTGAGKPGSKRRVPKLAAAPREGLRSQTR